jgi:hypothetical protein
MPIFSRKLFPNSKYLIKLFCRKNSDISNGIKTFQDWLMTSGAMGQKEDEKNGRGSGFGICLGFWTKSQGGKSQFREDIYHWTAQSVLYKVANLNFVKSKL